MHLAYKYVMCLLMLSRINLVGPGVDASLQLPVTQSNVQRIFVFPPNLPNLRKSDMPTYTARLDTDRFAFSFGEDGRLCFITRLHPLGGMSLSERNSKLAKEVSIINGAGAYSLASNWLTSFRVDVKKLEETTQVAVFQESQRSFITPDVKIALPLFEVRWRNSKRLIIDIEIDGRTKELLHLRLEDDSISGLQPISIKNPMDLYRIPDQEFLKYSERQRQELVKEFTDSQ